MVTIAFASTSVYGQATFAGIPISPLISGLSYTEGVAVDASGNLYIADPGNSNVVKETLAGGVYTPSVIATGVFPFGVAVDGSGKVYIADTGNNRLLLETPSGGTYTQSVIDPSVFQAADVVFDAAGNLYVSSENGVVTKETLSGGTYTPSTIANTGEPNIALAIDSSGNLYVPGDNTGNIYLETLSGGAYTQSILLTGFTNPEGIAIDPSGNLYISDFNKNFIYKEVLSGGIYTQFTLLSGLNGPEGLALDSSGNLFIAGGSGGTILEIQNNISFGSGSIGSPSSAMVLPFSIAAGTTVGSVSVLTTGLPNKDFLDAGSSTCTAQTYASATDCVVNVQFSGRSPGLRRGAVVFTDGSGNTLSMVPLSGTATGPQTEYFPSTTTVLNNTATSPQFVAVDGNSSVFIADQGTGEVIKVTSAGALSTLATGLTALSGIAVDGAGVVYATYNGTNILKIAQNGTQTVLTVAGANNLVGIALDGVGNMYLTDYGAGAVYMVAPDGTKVVVATGFGNPLGVAVDAVNNLYVADQTGGSITKITPLGVQSSIASGLDNVGGLAVDAAGDVYYTLRADDVIGEVPLGGSPTTLITTGNSLLGLAIDSSGNLFYADAGGGAVSRLNRQTPPALTFASTTAGGTSSDSPKIAALQNTGNMPLTVASVVYPVDFTENAAGSATDCVAGGLATAAVCTFYVDFKPTSAGGTSTTVNLLESIQVTTDEYNRPGSLTRILTTGTETKLPSSLVLSASNTSPVIGSTYTITATVSGSGPTPAGTVTFYSGGSFLATVAVNGSGAAIYAGSLPSGIRTITATYSGDATHITSNAVPLKMTIQKMTTSVSVTSSPNPAASGTPMTFTATVPTTLTGVAPTGKVSFYYNKVLVGQATIVNGASNTATLTTSSLTMTHTMTATYPGDGNYASAADTVGVLQTITP